MSGTGPEALPDVRVWSGYPPRFPRVVGRPFRMFGSGCEALPVVRRPFRMSGSGREAFPNVREWL